MTAKPPRKCERCDDTSVSGQRYCKSCKKVVLAEMREAGYLETGGFGRKGGSRTDEMKEVVHETRQGSGHG